MKADGFKSIYVSITPEHKEMLDKLCKNLRISQASLISYLLDCALDQTLPAIDEPFSFS
jgi:DNA-binding MarR family transcriptional regulator